MCRAAWRFSTSFPKRRLGEVGCALALGIGISTTAVGQVRPMGESDADWTVLTMAPDGTWGTATDGYVNRAIANAIERCRMKSGRAHGCGAYFVSTQRGWALGLRCGEENILATGRTLAEVVESAHDRADELRRNYHPEMGDCRAMVTIAPDGSMAAPPTEALPVGKAPALATNCVSADQEAQRRIERQGEMLDVDPVLFAESYNALIRARIACRAGLLSQALSLYDEIQESLREKLVPDNRPLEAAR
jgi:hypothetical protein